MNDFTQMHIYFYVTTVAVVLIGILAIVVLGYIVKILNDIKYISSKARKEADLIAADLSELRENVREKGAKLKYFTSFFSNLYKNHKKK